MAITVRLWDNTSKERIKNLYGELETGFDTNIKEIKTWGDNTKSWASYIVEFNWESDSVISEKQTWFSETLKGKFDFKVLRFYQIGSKVNLQRILVLVESDTDIMHIRLRWE